MKEVIGIVLVVVSCIGMVVGLNANHKRWLAELEAARKE